jgi:hypothetical protein
MGCGNELSESDDKAVEESINGENCNLPEEVQEKISDVREEISSKVEELARERVEEHRINEIPERELGEEVSPERAEKILKDEFYSATKEVRDTIWNYKYIPEDRHDEEGNRIGGCTQFILGRAHIEIYKGDFLEVAESATHERWEVAYRVSLTPEQITEVKGLYLEAILGINGKEPVTDYAWKNEREYFCECMKMFKYEPETLKMKDPDMFEFCKQIYVSSEIERIKEELLEGGFIFPPI